MLTKVRLAQTTAFLLAKPRISALKGESICPALIFRFVEQEGSNYLTSFISRVHLGLYWIYCKFMGT